MPDKEKGDKEEEWIEIPLPSSKHIENEDNEDTHEEINKEEE